MNRNKSHQCNLNLCLQQQQFQLTHIHNTVIFCKIIICHQQYNDDNPLYACVTHEDICSFCMLYLRALRSYLSRAWIYIFPRKYRCVSSKFQIAHSHFDIVSFSSICNSVTQQEESLISVSSGFKSLRMHTQGCHGCKMTRNFVRNSKILIARSTIQPKLSKIKNH